MRPFNAVYVVAYGTYSKGQESGNTEIHSSVQCLCTQCSPVKALVELVKSDHAAISGLYCGVGSIGHRAFKRFKHFIRTLNTFFSFYKQLVICGKMFYILTTIPSTYNTFSSIQKNTGFSSSYHPIWNEANHSIYCLFVV